MTGKKLENMPLTGLVVECIAKDIPYKGKDADALREKLSPKKSTTKSGETTK